MYIAHISEDKRKQTVSEHLLGTSYLCEQFGEKLYICNMARLAGITHDLGKFTQDFCNYIQYSAANPQDKSLRGKITHSTQGAKYVTENCAGEDALSSLTTQVIALAIASHHGGLMDCVSPQGTMPFNERILKEDPKLCYQEALENYSKEFSPHLNDLFCAAKKELLSLAQRSKAQGIGGSFTLHLIVKFLFSCLIDADRYDTYLFMAGLTAQIPKAEIPPWQELSSRLELYISSFSADTHINKLRGEISEQCKDFAARGTGIYQLSVPTGGGKTFASLRYALEHARLHGKDRIIYIIPYNSIIDQNAAEIRKVLKQDELILEHHSNINWDEENENYELLTERWDSPIILTTMVQFLNTLYDGGTRSVRRMHNLANSVLIFDEIQSVPLKCIHLLSSALNFLSKICGSTVVLCTATQPSLSQTEHPLLLSENAQMVRDVSTTFRQFKRTNLVDSRIDAGYNTQMLCDFTFAKLEGLQTSLVILNTKKDAENLYREINRHNNTLPVDKQYFVYHLSTSMCPAHRINVLDDIRKKLPKERVICISTQLIEAGVDVSFQCVIRALAGLDSIAQAAGRCNRNAENICKNVYIVNIRDENITKLPSIKIGQEAAERILNEIKRNPEAYEGDLLSPVAMEQYYQYYFHKTKNLMYYDIPAISGNIYDLLGQNDLGCNELANRLPGTKKPPLTQAFATAGKYFSVIDDNTTSILVPYDKEGERIIQDLAGKLSLPQRKNILRQAQQYSVNVFDYMLNILENQGAIYTLPGGLLALQPQYYHKQTGVSTQPRTMDALLI